MTVLHPSKSSERMKGSPLDKHDEIEQIWVESELMCPTSLHDKGERTRRKNEPTRRLLEAEKSNHSEAMTCPAVLNIFDHAGSERVHLH